MPRLPRRARKAAPPRVRPGTMPGTVHRPQPEAPIELRVMVYDAANLIEERVDTLERAFALHEEPGLTWFDVVSPDTATLTTLGERFGLHPLALEDVAESRQRPKLEAYQDYLFIVLRAVRPDPERIFASHQVALFVGAGFVVTVRDERHGQFEPVRDRLRASRGRIRERGADYLAYALTDALVDHYLPVLDAISGRLEQLADDLLGPSTEAIVGHVQEARRALGRLRRISMPMRDVVEALQREPGIISDETRVFLRDCADHAVTILDSVEQLREQATQVMDVHMALVNHRMNEVMKVLTVMSTVFIPLSFLAGLWGMNFDVSASPWNMPELSWRYGYPFALGLMAAVTVVLLVFFRRKGWLGAVARSHDDTRRGDDD